MKRQDFLTPALSIALLLGCNSEGGYHDPLDLSSPQPDLTTAAPSCGNGVLDSGELCDPAIAANQPGACPASCPAPADPCQALALEGSRCQLHCTATAITTPTAGDGCCPTGATSATDSDCRPFTLVGSEVDVCGGGKYHVPVLATGGGNYAVGCVPNGSPLVAPVLHILDAAGASIQTQSLLQMDGYYYNEVQTSYFDGRFQALYQYVCSDTGSWAPGRGWGCIDFREYAPTGSELTPSLVFGQRGHNGHPVLDWNGSGFGVGWISYDTLFARLIDKDRKLLGGDKFTNILIQQDPKKSDSRNSARTRIHWNGSGYGMFTIVGNQLYFTKLSRDGAQLLSLQPLGTAFAQSGTGNLSSVFDGTVYHVSYYDYDRGKLLLLRVDGNGKSLGSLEILSSEYVYPSLLLLDGRLFLFTHDAGQQGMVHVVSLDGKLIESSPLGKKMIYPQAAYDSSRGKGAVVYLNEFGQLKFQALHHGP